MLIYIPEDNSELNIIAVFKGLSKIKFHSVYKHGTDILINN
jgi:hypothetical protein